MPSLEMPYIPSHMGSYTACHDNVDWLNLVNMETAARGSFVGHFECKRCDRAFGSRSAREQHWEASAEHFICLALENGGNGCTFDGATVDELLEHYLVVHNLQSCRGCLQVFVDFNVYMDHLDREFACPECHRHHDSENSVHQHMITHRERDVGCWACERVFTMVLHMEAGCVSGIDRNDLNHHAACFVPSWKFLDPAYRQKLMHSIDLSQLYPNEHPAPFTCPDVSCRASFTTLGGLFQHVEFGKCPASLTEGLLASLIAWLAHKVAQPRSVQSLFWNTS